MGMEDMPQMSNTSDEMLKAEEMAHAGYSWEVTANNFKNMTPEDANEYFNKSGKLSPEQVEERRALYERKAREGADLDEVTAANKFDKGE